MTGLRFLWAEARKEAHAFGIIGEKESKRSACGRELLPKSEKYRDGWRIARLHFCQDCERITDDLMDKLYPRDFGQQIGAWSGLPKDLEEKVRGLQ